jgi:hypothetical protein
MEEREDKRMEGWKNGILEEWENQNLEYWKDGRMERQKNGRMEYGPPHPVLSAKLGERKRMRE